MTKREGAHDPVFDQIADWLGGWEFSWEAGFEAYERVVEGGASEADARRALVFAHRSHALQSGLLAEAEGAEAPLIAAALLHDIGHGFAPPPPAGRAEHYDDKHEVVGALWLRQVFVPEVSEPVFHHVAAKRYLVATRPDYRDRLAEDSVLSLAAQGGGMSPDEVAACRASPHFEEGVRLRCWDDDAKLWSRRVPPLAHFLPVLEASLQR